MKLAIFGLLLFSFQSFAGEISIGNGKSTIEISIGDDRSDERELNRRVRVLERAVRDLQAKVYNLTQAPVVTEQWSCTLTPFTDRYEGNGTTENMARVNASRACSVSESEMFCRAEKAKCLKIQ